MAICPVVQLKHLPILTHWVSGCDLRSGRANLSTDEWGAYRDIGSLDL